ncbi:ATP-dependent Clp protease proteolytic subunit [Mesorhizobium retamae]|uniref:ATP-dependent Clp protease proteolytic subunit n=1 Tax=Mesorhizobium retamae TaxID=2912854 RepID=A0ABS9QNI5_9HYPH|nr:ATP-dependent Clp protease proteolytic subunit [Mesorhizobium sp. IRAMC:0171]MCG7508408.1 ATP-dependent Clp protease proteolytic subunit [Mesorhizobium sp. IRAMC:0171]
MIHMPSYRPDNGRATNHDAEPPDGPAQPPSDDKLLVGSNVQINGMINDDLFLTFMKQLGDVRASNEDLILELMTQGGDADTARRIALEIRVFKTRSGKNAYAIGKTAVMSAGITIFSAFDCANRFLTPDATLLIHERHISRTITLEGPIKSCMQIVREESSALETAERVEREDFEHFVKGSSMSADDLFERAKDNCYLTAQDALDLRLIARIIG